MTVLLADFKISQRVDNDEDDGLLQGYLNAANSYVINAIGADDASNTFYSCDDVVDLFNTAVSAQAGAYYQYRSALANTAAVPVTLVTDSIITQLRAMWEQWQQSLETSDGD